MGSSKKSSAPDNTQLAAQYQQQQAQEQQRLDQQRAQYETERANLLSQLNAQQEQQRQAQTEQQKLLATQNVQQGQAQAGLIEQLKAQYGAQTEALNQQLATYGDLSKQQDKQSQYLGYLQTQASAQANTEKQNVSEQLAIDTRNNANRMGVLSSMNRKRTKAYSPETATRGTGTISSSKLLR